MPNPSRKRKSPPLREPYNLRASSKPRPDPRGLSNGASGTSDRAVGGSGEVVGGGSGEVSGDREGHPGDVQQERRDEEVEESDEGLVEDLVSVRGNETEEERHSETGTPMLVSSTPYIPPPLPAQPQFLPPPRQPTEIVRALEPPIMPPLEPARVDPPQVDAPAGASALPPQIIPPPEIIPPPIVQLSADSYDAQLSRDMRAAAALRRSGQVLSPVPEEQPPRSPSLPLTSTSHMPAGEPAVVIAGAIPSAIVPPAESLPTPQIVPPPQPPGLRPTARPLEPGPASLLPPPIVAPPAPAARRSVSPGSPTETDIGSATFLGGTSSWGGTTQIVSRSTDNEAQRRRDIRAAAALRRAGAGDCQALFSILEVPLPTSSANTRSPTQTSSGTNTPEPEPQVSREPTPVPATIPLHVVVFLEFEDPYEDTSRFEQYNLRVFEAPRTECTIDAVTGSLSLSLAALWPHVYEQMHGPQRDWRFTRDQDLWLSRVLQPVGRSLPSEHGGWHLARMRDLFLVPVDRPYDPSTYDDVRARALVAPPNGLMVTTAMRNDPGYLRWRADHGHSADAWLIVLGIENVWAPAWPFGPSRVHLPSERIIPAADAESATDQEDEDEDDGIVYLGRGRDAAQPSRASNTTEGDRPASRLAAGPSTISGASSSGPEPPTTTSRVVSSDWPSSSSALRRDVAEASAELGGDPWWASRIRALEAALPPAASAPSNTPPETQTPTVADTAAASPAVASVTLSSTSTPPVTSSNNSDLVNASSALPSETWASTRLRMLQSSFSSSNTAPASSSVAPRSSTSASTSGHPTVVVTPPTAPAVNLEDIITPENYFQAAINSRLQMSLNARPGQREGEALVRRASAPEGHNLTFRQTPAIESFLRWDATQQILELLGLATPSHINPALVVPLPPLAFRGALVRREDVLTWLGWTRQTYLHHTKVWSEVGRARILSLHQPQVLPDALRDDLVYFVRGGARPPDHHAVLRRSMTDLHNRVLALPGILGEAEAMSTARRSDGQHRNH